MVVALNALKDVESQRFVVQRLVERQRAPRPKHQSTVRALEAVLRSVDLPVFGEVAQPLRLRDPLSSALIARKEVAAVKVLSQRVLPELIGIFEFAAAERALILSPRRRAEIGPVLPI